MKFKNQNTLRCNESIHLHPPLACYSAFCAGENNKIDIIWQTQRDVSHVFVSEAPDHVSSDGGNHV